VQQIPSDQGSDGVTPGTQRPARVMIADNNLDHVSATAMLLTVEGC